ncbi:hypothetical protein DPMN_094505 [Dreissena polymorpha]|uniref:GOLD domain-containing protein n=1 Tax=Dreissena polymorpha TaxID=45954 RepID=A0A9D4R3L1_DREPO|nr:hypothetical protein DPMN_094505 [Dreissena polymorpha]
MEIGFISMVIVVCVFCTASARGTALTFEVPDQKRFCLIELFEGPKDYVLEYKVLKGGQQDIDVHVRSPNGKIIYRQDKASEGRFEFETSRGDYQICFSNEFSSWVHKVVYADLRPADVHSLAGEANQQIPFVRTSGESSCDEIHETLTTVMRFQRDFRIKESIGRHIAETLLSNVTWMSVFQTFAVLITGLGQTFILKRFFTDRTSELGIKEGT